MPLLCELGLHEWKWKYLKQNSCDIQLVCTQCRKTKGDVKVKHHWNKAYTRSNSCEMQESCTRCGTTTGPVGAVHEWEWVTLNPCATEQICKRCGAIGEIDEKEHLWKKIYTKPNFCEIQETCERCGTTKGPLNVVHEWEWLYPRPNSCIKREVCKRCGAIGKTDDAGQREWTRLCSDENRKEKYLVLQQSIGNLAKSGKLWYITSEEQTWDLKRHAGASSLVIRASSSTIKQQLPHTNILMYGVSFHGKYMFFFPDRVEVTQDQHSGSPDSVYASSYDGLGVSFSKVKFRETDPIPSDSKIIDYTWQYVRVDGHPDLRYAHNPRIPIVVYGQIELALQNGLTLLFQLSNPTYAQELAESLSDYIRAYTTPNYSTSWKTDSRREPTRPTRVDLENKNPYEILGVNSNASMDEIAAAYRKLAQENHPDKVAGLAQEFRELAERRMKIINLAYEELKRNPR